MHRSEGDLLLLSEFINLQMCIKIPGNVNGMFIKLAYTLDQKHGAWSFPISTNVAST